MGVTLVTKYNPRWPDWFIKIRRVLEASLGESYLTIEHVGSTAVPDMIAKPIIDITIVINGSRFGEIKERLAQLGYVHEGDKGIPGREAFDLRDAELRSMLPAHHLYVCAEDSHELKRHLAFRDFLRANRSYAGELSRLKWSLAEEHENDRQAYMDGKAALVQEITEMALREK